MNHVEEMERQLRRTNCPGWLVEGPFYGGSHLVTVYGLHQVRRIWLSPEGEASFTAGNWEHVVPVAKLGRYLKNRPETKPFIRRVLLALFG